MQEGPLSEAMPASDPPATRRALLSVDHNPSTTLDYLDMLEGHAQGASARITLRYVPDKLTLSPSAFADYLDALNVFAAKPLENLAVAILEDINNEVVPRWVQIVAVRGVGEEAGHRVLIEDRQPKWDNPPLLARLERY